MSHFLDLNDPMLRAMVFVQVVGFPLAFLVRSGVHIFRSKREIGQEKQICFVKAGYNLCFALMSLSFYFFRPAGALFLAGGIGLLCWQFILSRKTKMVDAKKPAIASPISIKSSRLSKRRV